MSTSMFPATEVLRGMDVEPAPLRLPTRPQPDSAGALQVDGPSEHEIARRQSLADAARAGREEGLRSGFEEGLRQGQAEGARRVQEAMDEAVSAARAPLQQEHERLRELLLGLAKLPQDCLLAAEDEMVALCFEAICRMLGSAALQPDAVTAQMRHLLSCARPGQRVTLHVHPDDASLLRGCGADAGLPIVPDGEVVLGGAIVRSTGGSLDARLETMLEACKATLLAARKERSATVSGDAA